MSKEDIQGRVDYIIKDLLAEKKIVNVSRNLNTIRKEIENDGIIFDMSYKKIGIDASEAPNRFDYKMTIKTRKDGEFYLLLNASFYNTFASVKDTNLKTFEEFSEQSRWLKGDCYTPIIDW